MTSRYSKIVLVLMLLCSTLIGVGCVGVAESLPSLSVAPDKLTVSAKVGSTTSLPVTLANAGKTPISVSQALLTGEGFSINGLTMPLSLATGQSVTFNVKFAASKVGSVDGTLTFMTDAIHRPAMLPLHGTGSALTRDVSSIVV